MNQIPEPHDFNRTREAMSNAETELETIDLQHFGGKVETVPISTKKHDPQAETSLSTLLHNHFHAEQNGPEAEFEREENDVIDKLAECEQKLLAAESSTKWALDMELEQHSQYLKNEEQEKRKYLKSIDEKIAAAEAQKSLRLSEMSEEKARAKNQHKQEIDKIQATHDIAISVLKRKINGYQGYLASTAKEV